MMTPMIDHKLYLDCTCKDIQDEANYLLAIINSHASCMKQSTSTPRLIGPKVSLARVICRSTSGSCPFRSLTRATRRMRPSPKPVRQPRSAPRGEVARLRADRDRVTVTIARRELRKWLRSSPEGQAVETAVAKLLA